MLDLGEDRQLLKFPKAFQKRKLQRDDTLSIGIILNTSLFFIILPFPTFRRVSSV